MNKKELIDVVAEKRELTKKEAEALGTLFSIQLLIAFFPVIKY